MSMSSHIIEFELWSSSCNEQVEQLIREENMVDVFFMIENYCNFMRGKSKLVQKNRLASSLISFPVYILFLNYLCSQIKGLKQWVSWGDQRSNIKPYLCIIQMWRVSRAPKDSWDFDFHIWERICCSCCWITR